MQAARLAGRLQRELRMLQTEPPPGVAAWLPSPLSLSLLHAQIEGPEGSVYAKGIFKLAVQVPDRYPFEPPNVRFVTPIYHPNIDNVGRICLDILNLPPKGVWRPSLNLSTVLASIGLLLAEPNPDDGLMIDITAEYKHHRATFDLKARTWTEKHAMQNLEIGFDGVGWDSLGDVLGEASEPTTSSSKMVGSHSDLATGKQPDNALEGNQEAFHRLDKQLVQLSKGRSSSRMTLNSLGRATENPPLKGSDGLCKGKENLTPDGRCAKDNRVMKGEVPRNEHGECLGRTVTSDESLADNNEEEVVVAMPEHMKEAPINDCRESLHQTITPNNEEEVVVVVPELMKEVPRKKSEESPHQTITPNNEEEVVIVHALMKEAPRNECRESPHQTITPDNEEEAVVVVPELMKEALRKKCKESPRQTITLDDEEEAVELAPKLMKEALRKKCKESPRQTITLDDEEEAVELAPKLMKEAPERNERGNSQRQTVEKCDERVVLAPVGMSWRSTQEKRVVEVNALKEERSIFLSLRSKSLKLSRPKEPKEPVLVDDALVEVSPTVIVSDSGSEEELAEGRYRLSLSQKSSTRKRKGSSKAR